MRHSQRLVRACERAALVLEQVGLPVDQLMQTTPPTADQWLWLQERESLQQVLHDVAHWLRRPGRRPARRRSRRTTWSRGG